jgi:ligand-binding sensor domain-containing protein
MSLRHTSRRAAAFALLALVSISGCVSAGGVAGAAGEGGYGRRDERVQIGSFASVPAVAVSRRFVFAAGSDGVAVYDRAFNRWLPPLSTGAGPDAALFAQPIGFLVGDPLEDALWIGVPGAVLTYRPDTEQLQRTMVVGMPDFIAFDRSGNGDAYVRSAGQYTRVSRLGITFPVSSLPAASALLIPPTLADLYRQFPTLRNQPQLFLRGQAPQRALRPATVLAGAASPDRASEVWLGTDSEGLFRFDPTFLQATPLPYGLLSPGVGGLALAADGVWAASLGVVGMPSAAGSVMAFGAPGSLRGGLSFVSNNLQQFRWLDGTIAVPLAGVRTYVLATRGARAWIGTERGVVRMKLDGANETLAWSALDGLPDQRVLSIAARDDGAWVGTMRGLRFVPDSGEGAAKRPVMSVPGARVLDNMAVYALQMVGDTLWAGTESGLLAIARPMQEATLLRPENVDPTLRRPVRALAWSDSVLLAVTDDAVLQVAPRTGHPPTRVEALRVPQIGQAIRAGIDERAIWIAGPEGVLLRARSGGTVRWLQRGIDLDGPVLDIVANRDWFWIGTPRGLLRLRRTSDGLVP